jgi:predicted ATPase
MSIRLRVENYRALRKIDWELPRGVCALVGPNGSGKTTLLEVPEVLRDIFADGVWRGLDQHGSTETLRNLHAERNEHVSLEIVLDSLEWRLDVTLDEDARPLACAELLRENQAIVAEQKHDQPQATLQHTALRGWAYEGAHKAKLREPIGRLTSYRLYHPHDLDKVRRGSELSVETVLLPRGENIFSLLRNWRDRRATKSHYDFVVESLRDAFPDVFEELELDAGALIVRGHFFAPGIRTTSMPFLHAPSGLLTGLLHLAAVASTEHGGVVAIDEPENGLHPYAVKRILQAMRAWANDKDLTVLLATHSPMLLDQFKEEPEHVYVMEPGRDILPVRLDEVRDRGWLARFSLGDLYKGGDFGAPDETAAA